VLCEVSANAPVGGDRSSTRVGWWEFLFSFHPCC